MQNEDRSQVMWRYLVFGCIVLLVVAADQLSKAWIRANLYTGQSLFDTGILRIIYLQTTGAAFGILQDQSAALTIFAFLGIVVILLLVFVLRSRWSFLDSLLVMSGIGLIMGGTVGNLIDRLRLGYVTDFIQVYLGEAIGYFPSFNVADAAISVGAGLLIIDALFFSGKAEKEA